MQRRRRFSQAAAVVLGWAAAAFCSAQTMPVALTLHITGRTGAALGNESIGIANGTGAPFSHYRSDAHGNVIVVLAPGPHDLRIQARGLPVAQEHVDVSAPETLEIAFGRKPKSTPERAARAAAPATLPAARSSKSSAGLAQPAGAPATPPAAPAPQTPDSSASASPAASSGALPAAPTPSLPNAPSPSEAAATAPPARALHHGTTRKTAPGAPVAPARTTAANPLDPWKSCFFPDGLEIQSVDSLNTDVASRQVDTAQGPQHIDLVDGARIMFAYPFTDFFANAKPEVLPANEYAQEKQTLLANLDYMESEQGGPEPARPLPPNLHGFAVRGDNLRELQSSATVLGMYLIFDDTAHVATTVYFLNQQSFRRKFQTMDEYRQLRDRFLTTYTGCVRENLGSGR